MIPCTACNAMQLDEKSQRCAACGYDAGRVITFERARERWISRRNVSGTIAVAGMVFTNAGVVFGSIAVAAVASLGFTASLFYAGYCILRTRVVERQLRAARSPQALPEARLL